MDTKAEYLYFSDPVYFNTDCSLPPSMYRIALNAMPKSEKARVELISSSNEMPHALSQPSGIDLSMNEQILYVSNCIEGEFSLTQFDLTSADSEGVLQNVQTWDIDTLKWKGDSFKGQAGCSNGLTIHPSGYLMVTCPGARVCIIDIETGVMKAGIKLPDNAIASDVAITRNSMYIATNHSLWALPLNQELLQL